MVNKLIFYTLLKYISWLSLKKCRIRIRIRILETKSFRIRADPNLEHCFLDQKLSSLNFSDSGIYENCPILFHYAHLVFLIQIIISDNRVIDTAKSKRLRLFELLNPLSSRFSTNLNIIFCMVHLPVHPHLRAASFRMWQKNVAQRLL